MVVAGNLYIRSLAAIVAVLGCVELVIGVMATNVVKRYRFGCWWTGLICLIAGLFGVIQGNKNIQGIGYCLRYEFDCINIFIL